MWHVGLTKQCFLVLYSLHVVQSIPVITWSFHTVRKQEVGCQTGVWFEAEATESKLIYTDRTGDKVDEACSWSLLLVCESTGCYNYDAVNGLVNSGPPWPRVVQRLRSFIKWTPCICSFFSTSSLRGAEFRTGITTELTAECKRNLVSYVAQFCNTRASRLTFKNRASYI
jgi:hypothetical protein